jgi:acylphosphatase
MTRTVRAVVSGMVQGVGFRYFVQRLAWHCDVTGWCRNRSDGTVEIVGTASPQALEAFLAGVGEGPPGAGVEAST